MDIVEFIFARIDEDARMTCDGAGPSLDEAFALAVATAIRMCIPATP